MMKGKVCPALQRSSMKSESVILNLDDSINTSSGTSSVYRVLKDKHPNPKFATIDTILPEGLDE